MQALSKLRHTLLTFLAAQDYDQSGFHTHYHSSTLVCDLVLHHSPWSGHQDPVTSDLADPIDLAYSYVAELHCIICTAQLLSDYPCLLVHRMRELHDQGGDRRAICLLLGGVAPNEYMLG